MEGANPMVSIKRLTIALAVVLLTSLQSHAQPPAPTPQAAGEPLPPPRQAESIVGRGPVRGDPPANKSGRPSEKIPLEVPPPPDRVLEKDLRPPPLEPGDLRFPINLATALRLADARPILVSAT